MKKWLLFSCVLFLFAGCSDDNNLNKNKENIDNVIREFFANSSYLNIHVKTENYAQANLPLRDIPEYVRVLAEKSTFERVHSELSACAKRDDAECEEIRERAHDLIYSSGVDFGCEIHDHEHSDSEVLEHCAYLVSLYTNRKTAMENLYTGVNYRVRTVLNERNEGRCTPVVFYLNEDIVIMSVDFRSEDAVECAAE